MGTSTKDARYQCTMAVFSPVSLSCFGCGEYCSLSRHLIKGRLKKPGEKGIESPLAPRPLKLICGTEGKGFKEGILAGEKMI